jgi:hypothetical protein
MDHHGADSHLAASALDAQRISPRLAMRIFSNI